MKYSSVHRSLKVLFIAALGALLLGCQGGPSLKELSLPLESLPDGAYLAGFTGPENLLVEESGQKIYVTDLKGSVTLLGFDSEGKPQVQARLKLGTLALGIARGRDGFLYAARAVGTKDEWLKDGGELVRISPDLGSFEPVAGPFPGINGVTTDGEGHLYFAVGNLDFWNPQGAVYRLKYEASKGTYSAPQVLRGGLRSPNGLAWSSSHGALILTEVFDGVSLLSLDGNTLTPVVGKLRLVEGFDDLAVDSQGRVWIADAVGGLIKRYDPENFSEILWKIKGLGVASSVRLWGEGDAETLLISEREREKDNDGQGLILIQVKAWESLFEGQR